MLKRSVIIMTIVALLLCFMAAPAKIKAEEEAFSAVAEDVASFKNGDTVNVKILIQDIRIERLAGVDLVAEYSEKLEPSGLSGTSIKDWDASRGAADPEEKTDWDLSGRADTGERKIYVYFTEEKTEGMGADGSLWVEMQFTALADSEGGETVVEITSATGADAETASLVNGKGCTVVVEAAEEPSEEPTAGPTEEPGNEPEVPNGGAYTVAASEVEEFRKDDEVRVAFYVKDTSVPLTDIDVCIAYRGAKLELTGAVGESEENMPEGWTVTAEIDDSRPEEPLVYLHFTGGTSLTIGEKDPSALRVTLKFTALQDGSEDEIIAYTPMLEGRDSAGGQAEGTGTVVKLVAAKVTPTPEPTDAPTPGPTERPTAAPTDKPTAKPASPTQKPAGPTSKPVSPPTYDPGMLPLVAAVLAALPILKKRS